MYSETVTEFLMRTMGGRPYAVLAFALFSIVPVGLLSLAIWRIVKGRSKYSLDGLALGLTVALWASVCWLAVPYCGGYPSLPGILTAFAVGGFNPPIDTIGEEIAVHAGNMVGWTLFVWLWFTLIRWERKPN
jgi:hypothetical protein